MGPVVGEDKVEAENHGIIIIQMIDAKTLKGKTHKEEGVVIKVEAGLELELELGLETWLQPTTGATTNI